MGRAWWLGLCLFGGMLCGAPLAFGQDFEGDVKAGVPTGTGFSCSVGAIRLEEVVRRSGSSEMFVAQWSGLIERIAKCVNQPSMRNTCVSVQGQYAPLLFEWGDGAPGSSAGSQKAVSEARAIAVRTRLRTLDLDEKRLVMLPVPDRGTYEGLQIRIARECSEGAAAGKMVQSGPNVELGLVGSGLFRGPSDVQSGLVRIGVGYTAHRLYTRADAGLLLGSSDTQRGGFELGFAIGIELLPAVQLGAVALYRQGADRLFASWLDRAWFVGLESRQCMNLGRTLWDMCLREAFFPVGSQTLRGKVVQGRVFRVPSVQGSVLRVDLGLSVVREF